MFICFGNTSQRRISNPNLHTQKCFWCFCMEKVSSVSQEYNRQHSSFHSSLWCMYAWVVTERLLYVCINHSPWSIQWMTDKPLHPDPPPPTRPHPHPTPSDTFYKKILPCGYIFWYSLHRNSLNIAVLFHGTSAELPWHFIFTKFLCHFHGISMWNVDRNFRGFYFALKWNFQSNIGKFYLKWHKYAYES